MRVLISLTAAVSMLISLQRALKTTGVTIKYDYIIVGSGSAGSVLASRLTEDAANSVLLLEAGGNNRNPLISVPMGFTILHGKARYFWRSEGQDEPAIPDRCMSVLQGKGLGGSSSINGMIAVRGHRGDYDEWENWGNKGWSYEEVLPYFKRLEARQEGEATYRGRSGPISVRSGLGDNPLYEAFRQAILEAGHPQTPDYNGASQWGVAQTQHCITQGYARRSSPLGAYLHPAMQRKNLTVATSAQATRILFEGKTACGIEYQTAGKTHRAMAGSEVIVSAGAYKTPQLLMLSGIGPADHLRDFHIDAIQHLPGVGQNLQDHLGSFVQHACTQPISLLETTKPMGQVKAAIHYALTGSGALSHYPTEKMAFLKSDPRLDRPDLQFYFGPFLRPTVGSSVRSGAMQRHGYVISWCQLRPKCRGSVTLASCDPLSAPNVLHNYLGTEEDREIQRRAVAMAREFHKQTAFDVFRGDELEPGTLCRSQKEVDQYIRETCHTHFHPVGTTKMGQDDMAVVDNKLRVHGVENLRVVDASIMPRIVGANTNIPTIMIAEKASDIIRNRPSLQAETINL
jgi:choline dehydrogenase